MRINFTRLGLILVILGAVLLFNVWTTPVMQYFTVQGMPVGPDETFAHGLFMAPVGRGNIVVEEAVLMFDPEVGDLVNVKFAIPVHLVVVSPSDIVLVDETIVTPYTVQVNFDERGEYVVYITNMADESYSIPLSLKFPRNGDVVNREADKFIVSIILTASGLTLFCLGLATTLFVNHKKTGAKTVVMSVETFKITTMS
ncbi:MAG: hypothetical protein FWH37_09585 [Candidatus Bathyarchaeota archaeon]|nr:hypothetical protein [Candidatus Termiticorpusculum sp.]